MGKSRRLKFLQGFSIFDMCHFLFFLGGGGTTPDLVQHFKIQNNGFLNLEGSQFFALIVNEIVYLPSVKMH